MSEILDKAELIKILVGCLYDDVATHEAIRQRHDWKGHSGLPIAENKTSLQADIKRIRRECIRLYHMLEN